MTQVQSNAFRVEIIAAASSQLAIAAAAMSAGTWVQFTSATNQNAVLGVGPQSGSMLHYANQCAWNPINQCIEIVGADHNYGANMRYARFNAASNAFVLVSAGGDSINSGLGPGHEFAGTVVNPYTGDTYYRHYMVGDGGGSVGSMVITRAPLNGSAFNQSVPSAGLMSCAVNTGTVWWSGSFTGGSGAGAQGCLVVYNAASGTAGGAATDGYVTAYDPVANAWIFAATSMSPFYATGSASGLYHEVAAYSAVKNCMVYGGGNSNERKVWRMSSNGTPTAMPDIPVGRAVGIQRGNLVADPVTGNFLVLTANELWEMNPTGAGTWTLQTGSRAAPAGVGRPGPQALGAVDGIVSCAIPEYGVVAYIKQTSPTNSAFYLYKHA